MTQIEEEPAAAAAEQALPVAEDEEPERAGLLCSPLDTNTESLCCSEFQRRQFLLEKMAESCEDRAVCNLSLRLYALSEQFGIGYIFPDPESELETPAKARREKQTSEHRESVLFFYTNSLATIVLSPGERDNVAIRK